MQIWGPEYFMLLWLQSYKRKYINVPIANESGRTVKRREQLLSYSGGHLHPIIKACRRKSIDLIGSFPGNSMKFGSIENNEGQGRRWRRQRRQQHSGQKHLKIFLRWSCLRLTSTVRLWDQEHCCQFIVTKLPKLGNLKWGSFWLLVKVLHYGDSLVLVVDVTSHQSSIDSFHGDHAELLLKAHCLVIFWSVIHKTYEDSMQCNQCSFKCQIF